MERPFVVHPVVTHHSFQCTPNIKNFHNRTNGIFLNTCKLKSS